MNLNDKVEELIKKLMNDELNLKEKQDLANYLRFTLNQTQWYLEKLQKPFMDEIRVDIPKWIVDPKKEKLESKDGL